MLHFYLILNKAQKQQLFKFGMLLSKCEQVLQGNGSPKTKLSWKKQRLLDVSLVLLYEDVLDDKMPAGGRGHFWTTLDVSGLGCSSGENGSKEDCLLLCATCEKGQIQTMSRPDSH